MDSQNFIEVFRESIDQNPTRRRAAEHQLAQLHTIIGFAPTLLQVVMQASVEQPVRQAAAVYLKNFINTCWSDHETVPGKPIPFSIYEQDRAIIRSVIMDAMVQAPELIRVQLSVCVNHIINNDFPGRWPQVVVNISICLQNQNVNAWNGGLVTMYQLVKIYDDEQKDQTPLYEAMNLLLSMIYQLMVRLLTDQSVQSVLLQKQILKIYYALTRYSLPLELITKEIFSQWMEICCHVADCEVPDSSHLADDERKEFPYWKAKKWALHILVCMFKRYGSPHIVVNEKYQQFAEWYLPTFSQGVLKVLMKILDQYRKGVYVSPRVLTYVLCYLKRAVCHAFTWKLMKPFMEDIIQDVIFPILSFSDSDQKLWERDPCEFIRLKLDTMLDYANPVMAAESLLLSICKKRKRMLTKAIDIIFQKLAPAVANDREKDGAMHMTGTLANVLLKRAQFRQLVEALLIVFVFPEFKNPAGHMRARACWVLQYFSDLQIKNPRMLAEIMRLSTNALLTDKELPVKVEAAICLQRFLSYQCNAPTYVKGEIKEITKELLTILRETENEDLTNVLQKIVCTFIEQLLPVATEICQHLAITLRQILESVEESREKIPTVWSLLRTYDILLTVMELHPDVLLKVHPIVVDVVKHIFQHSITEFYGETLPLVFELTTKYISPEMWQMLELLYQVFKKDGMDHYTEFMQIMYNYVIVDTPGFLSNPNRLLAFFDMCQTIIASNPGENHEWHAAKLMEVIILQCKGQIDSVIHMFVELAVSRLRREMQSSELRTMCLQVVIAALYYNPQLLLSILDKMSQQNNESISALFIKQWLHDTDCFLGIHDRKLCVLGLCTLISLGDAKPQVLSEVAGKIVSSFIWLLNGLKHAYELKAQKEESEEEDDDYSSKDPLSSDEDAMDEMGSEEEEREREDEFELESDTYQTPIDDEAAIDEFWTFKEVITALSVQDQTWYALLTSNLTPEQAKALQEVLVITKPRNLS